MSQVYNLVVVLHLLGMAAVVGGYLAALRPPRVLPAMLWGARAQILTGPILLALATLVDSLDREPDNAKMAVKLVVALVVVGAAESWAKQHERVAGTPAVATGTDPGPSTTLVHVAGIGAILNVAVAALWR